MFAYYELIPYNYSFLSAEQKFIVHDSFRQLIAQSRDAHVLLADEPTGNLDSVTSMEVVGLLKNCAKKYHQTVILVTHQEEVAQMADRIIRIEDGRIAE